MLNWSEANNMLKSISGEDLSKGDDKGDESWWSDVPTSKHVRTPKQKENLRPKDTRGRIRRYPTYFRGPKESLNTWFKKFFKRYPGLSLRGIDRRLHEDAGEDWKTYSRYGSRPYSKKQEEMEARKRDRKAQRKLKLEHGGAPSTGETMTHGKKIRRAWGGNYHPVTGKPIYYQPDESWWGRAWSLGAPRKKQEAGGGRTQAFMKELRRKGGMPEDSRVLAIREKIKTMERDASKRAYTADPVQGKGRLTDESIKKIMALRKKAGLPVHDPQHAIRPGVGKVKSKRFTDKLREEHGMPADPRKAKSEGKEE